jgi:UDP-MurNAc hydroxylase
VVVTFLGHAGLLLQTEHGSVLHDPFFTPAFGASWFPFPANGIVSRLPEVLNPDYLYVSHLHEDHFDRRWLRGVNKDATVLLPDYPLATLEDELRKLGFTRFVRLQHGVPTARAGLTFTSFSVASPIDGPIGDSSLIVDDGEVRVFDQNDSRPPDLREVQAAGPFDLHVLQHSGALWYPMVYRMPQFKKEALVRLKRKNQQRRAMNYVRAVDARYVAPAAGPPCFLDPELFHLNELDEETIFPDQSVFLGKLQNGVLGLPGTRGRLTPDGFTVEHLMDPDHVFGEAKRTYLERYAARAWRGRPPGMRTPWLAADLKAWMTPLVQQANRIAEGIGGSLVIDWGDDAVALDFVTREVRSWRGSPFVLRLIVEKELLEDLVARRVENWPDDFMLGCRFEAERDGPYNDFVYAFLRCLSPERLAWAEDWFARRDASVEMFTVSVPGDGRVESYEVQRTCPHLGADLTHFGDIRDGVLTCSIHGHAWSLEDGRCLNADSPKLRVRSLTSGLR